MKDPEDDCIDCENSGWMDLGDGDWVDIQEDGDWATIHD